MSLIRVPYARASRSAHCGGKNGQRRRTPVRKFSKSPRGCHRRERRLICPALFRATEIRLKFLERRLRKATIGRDLAAEYGEYGCLTARAVEFEFVIARDFGRVALLIVAQWSNPGVAPTDIGRGQCFAEVVIDGLTQIFHSRQA